MTSSEDAGTAPGRHSAEADMALSAAPPDAVAGDRTPDITAHASSAAGPPDDIQELRQEIEETREQLGETVQQLAAKADVKARAQDKAAELTHKVKAAAGQARAQVPGWLVTAGKPAWQAAPEPVRQAVGRGASSARQRRAPLLAVTAALLTGYVAIRWWRRR